MDDYIGIEPVSFKNGCFFPVGCADTLCRFDKKHGFEVIGNIYEESRD